MAQRREAAVLLTGGDGRMEGILTATDITRRLIAQVCTITAATIIRYTRCSFSMIMAPR